jgi:tetratricopeptide (TPR) repeat protein
LDGWARREAVLVSCLVAAAALAGLSVPLGVPWLAVAGVIVAAAGGLSRLVMSVQRARLESRRERLESARQLRVPVAPITEVDPTLIGVDLAAQTVLPGGELPDYIGREVDAALRDAVAAALDGRGRWLVVVVGGTKVGKSRTLFEALGRCSRARELELVTPVNGDALRSLLIPGLSVRARAAHAVLWLDDLEPFLNQGVTLQTLREWQAGGQGRIVAATYGGRGSELIAGSSTGGLATIAADVLQHAREISLRPTTAGELDPLRARLSDAEFEAVQRHGLAAYLVAGPALERKLITSRHAPGENPCPEGVAVVYTAIDWARCGRTDPISHEILRQLWPTHLAAGSPDTDDGFATGVAWALRPVAATIALLQRTGSYQAYDYVIRLVRDKPGAEPPRDPAWVAAIETATTATEAFAVGVAAYRHSRLKDAATAFTCARESSVDGVAAIAGYNLGVVLGELGPSAEAVAAYDEMVTRYGDHPTPALREQVATALYNKGIRLGALGRSAEAVAAYDEVVTRYGDHPTPALREQVAKALYNKGFEPPRV